MGEVRQDQQQIASLSGTSENTVKHHLTRIFGKLAVENRGQLVQRLAECEAKVAPGFARKFCDDVPGISNGMSVGLWH